MIIHNILNMKRNFFFAVGLALSLFACDNSHDDMYDPTWMREQYNNQWEMQFGEIDPNHTWNMAKQVKANVDVSNLPDWPYVIKVYSNNPIIGKCYLLAEKEFEHQTTLSFDALESLDMLYVTVEGKQGLVVNGYYKVEDYNLNISTKKIVNRSVDECPTTIGDIIISQGSYYDPTYKDPTNPYATMRPYEAKYHVLENVVTQSASPWLSKDLLKIVGPGGVFEERVKNWEKYESVLDDGVSYQMNSTGPMSLTYCFGATTDDNMFGYFYYFNETERKNANYYVLMESARPGSYITLDKSVVSDMSLANLQYGKDDAQIQGTKLHLVYFDEEGNASYDFPKGINIEFFLVNKSASNTNVNNYFLNHYFSTEESQMDLGCKSMELPNVAAVTYNYGKTTFLGFEDQIRWGDGDMNDILFLVNGDFDKPIDINPDPEPIIEPQSWTVACEDLGSIGDFDFNDVVFKVSHVSGSGEITVTPLAAGGTMTVNLYHGSQLLGEIHNLLGVDDVTKMINTGLEGEKGFTSSVSESKTLSVSDSFSMTDNMGGFRLEILNGDGRFAAEIQGPVNGDSPQMICVPGEWRWPREWQKISDAYPDFVNWNSTNNAEWYKNSNSEYIY